MKTQLKNYALVTIGAFIGAIALNGFMLGNQIAAGGVGGLAVSANYLFGWAPGTFTLLVNLPLLVLCYLFLGKSTFFSTLYGSWLYPICINLTAWVPNLTENQLLGGIFGGLLMGISLGLIFMGNSSTGGTGIPIKILHKYTPLSLGLATILIDGLVVLTGFIAFDIDAVLYSIISLVVTSYVTTIVMTGFQSSQNMLIISEKADAIKQQIIDKIERGVSEIPILGGYTGQEKRLLMTTLSSMEVPAMEKIITDLDPLPLWSPCLPPRLWDMVSVWQKNTISSKKTNSHHWEVDNGLTTGL